MPIFLEVCDGNPLKPTETDVISSVYNDELLNSTGYWLGPYTGVSRAICPQPKAEALTEPRFGNAGKGRARVP